MMWLLAQIEPVLIANGFRREMDSRMRFSKVQHPLSVSIEELRRRHRSSPLRSPAQLAVCREVKPCNVPLQQRRRRGISVEKPENKTLSPGGAPPCNHPRRI